jgi:hypothetical protein
MTRFSSEWWWYGFTHFFIPWIATAFGIAIFTKRRHPEKDPGFFARFLEGLAYLLVFAVIVFAVNWLFG